MDLMNFEKAISTLSTLVVTYGLRILGAVVALFIGWVVVGWTSRVTRRVLDKRFDRTLSAFLAALVKYSLSIFVVLSVLGIFGVSTTSFAAVIGGGSLAIGLAFQGTLGNFAAGLMLLIFRPFSIGDTIVVGSGHRGVVDEITLISTTLNTNDNRRIIVPNTKVFGEVLENVSHLATRRVDISVGCAYGADIDSTRQILEGVAAKIDGSLSEPAPTVFLAGLGPSSVDWQVRVWCNKADYSSVWQQTLRDIKYALDDAQIEIPFPQLDVHIDR